MAASISSGVPPAKLMRMTFSARPETWVANRVLILSSSSLEVQESRGRYVEISPVSEHLTDSRHIVGETVIY